MTNQNAARLKYGGWGVAIGAGIAIVLGFTLGGWVTSSRADEMSEEAVLASRSAICVAQFMKAPNQEEQLKTFRETDSWERRKFVEQGGWDKMPGEERAKIYVSSACAEGIEAQLQE